MLHDEWLETAITYKVDWERELRRREQFGIIHLPDPLPHPDHVILDFDAGTAKIVGPMTKEEKVQYDDILRRRDEFDEEVRELIELRKTFDDPKIIARVDEDIARSRRIVEMIDARLGR